jgi:hypothetical protein
MENPATFSELRGMLRVAKQLRKAATETGDLRYATLFITTATSLESRVKERAFGSHGILIPREGHYFPDQLEPIN